MTNLDAPLSYFTVQRMNETKTCNSDTIKNNNNYILSASCYVFILSLFLSSKISLKVANLIYVLHFVKYATIFRVVGQ